jgi:hypothetical protein
LNGSDTIDPLERGLEQLALLTSQPIRGGNFPNERPVVATDLISHSVLSNGKWMLLANSNRDTQADGKLNKSGDFGVHDFILRDASGAGERPNGVRRSDFSETCIRMAVAARY